MLVGRKKEPRTSQPRAPKKCMVEYENYFNNKYLGRKDFSILVEFYAT